MVFLFRSNRATRKLEMSRLIGVIADDTEDGEIARDEAIGDDSADRPITGCENLLADSLFSRLGGSDLCAEFFEHRAALGEVAGICPPGQIGAGVDDLQCACQRGGVETSMTPLDRRQGEPDDTRFSRVGKGAFVIGQDASCCIGAAEAVAQMVLVVVANVACGIVLKNAGSPSARG